MEAQNMKPKSNSKTWMSDEYDIPVPENEEMWSQRVIDEYNKELLEKDDNVNKKEKD